jgi:hypothetical protein
MQVSINCDREAAIVETRLRALQFCLGPTVELVVCLPDGRRLAGPRGGLSPAAQCASLNERIEDVLATLDDQSRGSR